MVMHCQRVSILNCSNMCTLYINLIYTHIGYCINVDQEKGRRLVIGNFEKAGYLKISGTQDVTVSRFVELVN
jgi:hypothetical protein